MSTHPTAHDWARRVDALLAKAASTDFAEEAEACLAKAQSLMARHAIDDELLRRSGAKPRPGIVTRTTVVERPYASARCALLGAVAVNNHCRLVLGRTFETGRECFLVGHEWDLDHVMAMFATLSVHATRSMLAARADRRARSYRHAFLLAYAHRIKERLGAARQAANADAARAGSTGVELALVERWSAVDRVVRSEFPVLRPVSSTASSGAGLAGGRAAADQAPLGRAPLPPTAAPALESGR